MLLLLRLEKFAILRWREFFWKIKKCSTILPNYRLTERLYADVDYAPGKQVHGFVYLLRVNDVARLDRCEGYPRIYRRYTVDVILNDGTELPALIYEMTPKTKEIRNGLPYPEVYRQICREGANLHRIKVCAQ